MPKVGNNFSSSASSVPQAANSDIHTSQENADVKDASAAKPKSSSGASSASGAFHSDTSAFATPSSPPASASQFGSSDVVAFQPRLSAFTSPALPVSMPPNTAPAGGYAFPPMPSLAPATPDMPRGLSSSDFTESAIRDRLRAVDPDSMTGPQLLDQTATLVKGLMDSYQSSGRLKTMADNAELASAFAKDQTARGMEMDEAQALAEIERGHSRGFTGMDGTIYVKDGPEAPHDILHEITHVASAEGGNSKLIDTNRELNEGVTEYFTREFAPRLGVGEADAYPAATKFVQDLAERIGPAPLYQAYFADEGVSPIASAAADAWHQNDDAGVTVGRFSKPVGGEKDAQAVARKLEGFLPDNAVWLGFFEKRIFPEPNT